MPTPKVNRHVLGLAPSTLLGLIAILSFLPVLFNHYNLDDNLVTQKHRLTSQGLKAIPEIFTSPYFNESVGSYEYRPVTLASFALEHQVFGEKPEISHLINLLLYAGCLIAVWFFLQAALPYHPALAFLTSLFFLLHPLHTEVVASIKNRDELLAFLFGLFALVYWFRFWGPNGSWASFGIGFLLLILGLLSKRSFIPLLAGFLIWGAFFIQQSQSIRYWVIALPSILLIALLSPAWLFYQQLAFVLISLLFLTLSAPASSSLQKLKYVRLNLSDLISTIIQRAKQQKKTFKAILFVIINFAIITTAVFLALYNDDGLFSARLIIILIPFTLLLLNANTLYLAIALSGLLSGLLTQTNTLLILSTGFFIYTLIRGFLKLFIVFIFLSLVVLLFNLVGFGLSTGWDDLGQSLILFCYFGSIIGIIEGKKFTIPFFALGTIICTLMILILIIDFPIELLDVIILGFTLMGLPIIAYLFSDRFESRIQHIGLLGSVLVIAFGTINYEFDHHDKKNNGILVFLSAAEIKVHSYIQSNEINKVFPTDFPPGHYTKKIYGSSLPQMHPKPTPVSANQPNLNILIASPSITPVAETNRELTFVENPLGNHPTLSKRMAYGMGTIGYYTRLLFIPYPLSAYYGYDTVPNFSWQTGYTYLGLLVVLFLIGVIAYARWRKLSAVWLLGWWGLLGLVAVSNLVFPIAGIIGERLVFGTSLAFCAGIAWLFIKLLKIDDLQEFIPRLKTPTVGVWLLLGFFAIYQMLNIQRIRQWKDPITLFTADLEHFPRSSQGHQLLANRLKDAAEKSNNAEEQRRLYLQALNHYRQSAEIWPEYRESQLQTGNLSLLFQQPQEAISRFQKVLALGPGSGQLYFNMGNAYEQLNEPDSAIRAYQTAIRLQPDVLTYYTNLSFLFFKLKQVDSSLYVNRQATKQFPGTLEPLINLGKTFYQIQRWDSAIVYFELAYPLGKQDPNLVQVLAELHSKVGNVEKARFYREQLMPRTPNTNAQQPK